MAAISIGLFLQSTGQRMRNKARHYILPNAEAERIIATHTDSVRYVDFHIHTSMKNYYNRIKSPEWLRKNLSTNPKISSYNWGGSKADTNRKFNHFKSFRQADWGIIKNSGASILATSISPIEKRLLSPRVPLWYIPLSFRFINGKLVTKLPNSRLRKLYNKRNSSFNEFSGELEFLIAQKNVHPEAGIHQIQVVSDKTNLISNFKAGRTSLVLSMEGGHILHDAMISESKAYNERVFTQSQKDEIIGVIDKIKQQPQRVFFITLGHFAWNGLVGSAKSLDMDDWKRGVLLSFSRSRKFRSKVYRKYGDGIIGQTYTAPKNDKPCRHKKFCDCERTPYPDIQDIGYKVVEKLLDTSDGKPPIYIDVKHMDIQARFDYYKFLKDRNYKNVPIIASHVAMSGKDSAIAMYTGLCPVYDVYEEVKDPENWYSFQASCGCIKLHHIDLSVMGWFYPWSINLCKEEIPIIYNSDGIIGLSLEERVIGTNSPNYKMQDQKTIREHLKKWNLNTEEDIRLFNELQPLLRNVFYVIENCGRSDKTAWNHISIGSDFDGIAKPVGYCKTAAEIPMLWQYLNRYLAPFADFIGRTTLLHGQTPDEITDKIIFKNGERFILKYF